MCLCCVFDQHLNLCSNGFEFNCFESNHKNYGEFYKQVLYGQLLIFIA